MPTNAPAKADLFRSDSIERMSTAFESRLGKEIQALSLLIYPDHAVLQALNQRAPTTVEQWVYREGTLTDPLPVKLMGKGKLEDNRFPLDTVQLSALPALLQKARRHVDIPEGVVSRVLVKRNLPESLEVRIRVFITSERRDGSVDADVDGNLIEGDADRPR